MLIRHQPNFIFNILSSIMIEITILLEVFFHLQQHLFINNLRSYKKIQSPPMDTGAIQRELFCPWGLAIWSPM